MVCRQKPQLDIIIFTGDAEYSSQDNAMGIVLKSTKKIDLIILSFQRKGLLSQHPLKHEHHFNTFISPVITSNKLMHVCNSHRAEFSLVHWSAQDKILLTLKDVPCDCTAARS